MKLKLLFIFAVLTISIGFSQNVLEQIKTAEALTNYDSNLALLGDNKAALSKIVLQYHSIQEEDFVISPNPSKDKLNIKLSIVNEDLKLEVFDVLGKLIYKRQITHLESSINVSNWKSGVYLVRLSSDKDTYTKRFIKQ